MMKRRSRYTVVTTTFVSAITLALCGGCGPIDGGEFETFVREVLRSAAAAFLL